VLPGTEPFLLDLKGETPFGPAFVDNRLPVNLLSHGAAVDNHCEVRYDRHAYGDAFKVVTPAGDQLTFKREKESGNLYVCRLPLAQQRLHSFVTGAQDLAEQDPPPLRIVNVGDTDLQAGDWVEARYKGKAKYFPGAVAKVHRDREGKIQATGTKREECHLGS
jgi:hypothetical protein